ncbi:ATP-binding protein [Prosthecomicrobium pneumaticum]|uniref:histidine kinase n=1 Tax=Prosthecomicrobium pneumaticum TaxID=81895 RepID=A0A7W9FNP4_9HYPH|nr:ATP-binding protein [Prosthecomicrobium pneumaticum]MBB5753971.1 light-regulated signal transduction histidine kinase (bacteriophytochrome) [Prosthecomicrobium pneumaticum]
MTDARDDTADLDLCAREPIHIPGAIQPYGVLLVIDPGTLRVVQASANAAEKLGAPLEAGTSLPAALPALAEALSGDAALEAGADQQRIEAAGRHWQMTLHRSGAHLVAEFEAPPAAEDETMDRLFPRLRRFTETLTDDGDLARLTGHLARHVRALTGHDRALVYRFDAEWNGEVIAEDGNGRLPSYLGLRFPAGDIPAQARRLYRLSRLRMIPDIDYRPVPIMPAIDPPVDLSLATLRSVSPVHLEYMRNMGTAASMSVSILVAGELWGLVACHSARPHAVSLNIRNACDFAVQAAAARIEARERSAGDALRLRLGEVLGRLLGRMAAASDWRRGLVEAGPELLAQVGASGAAIVAEGSYHAVGDAPEEAGVRAIVAWLEARGEGDLYATPALATLLPEAASFAAVASGLLAIRISELHPSWLLWFRPEVVRTVSWGGDPHKTVAEHGRIHPRASFAAWQEQVRLTALPWRPAEITAAQDLRAAIVGIVLRKAEELAALTQELQRSNKELEAFSYSVSHDLRAPFRHIVGYSQLLRERAPELDEKCRHYLDSIADAALSAGRLVDDLLAFSQLGRTHVASTDVDMNKLVAEVKHTLAFTLEQRAIDWRIDPLPPAWGDPNLLRQVWLNLVENAVKYTRPRNPARIEVTGWVEGDETCYRVRDNGVGFDMAYVDKLFGVFQRLQRAEDFEGTGIGLALARRILDRHHGRITAQGRLDEGAEFMFALPRNPTRKPTGKPTKP